MWAALTSWDTIQAQLFSESWQDNTPLLLDVLSDQPWYLWTIIALAFLLLIVLEGAYRQSHSSASEMVGPGEGTWQSPALPGDQLFISMDEPRFAEPGTEGYPADAHGARLWMRAMTYLNTLNVINVESVELELLGRRIPSDWEPDTVSAGVTSHRYLYFSIPDWVKPGEHTVRLVACADGKWWRSPDYTISFP